MHFYGAISIVLNLVLILHQNKQKQFKKRKIGLKPETVHIILQGQLFTLFGA